MKKKWNTYLAILAAVVITVSSLPLPALAAPIAGEGSQTEQTDTEPVPDKSSDSKPGGGSGSDANTGLSTGTDSSTTPGPDTGSEAGPGTGSEAGSAAGTDTGSEAGTPTEGNGKGNSDAAANTPAALSLPRMAKGTSETITIDSAQKYLAMVEAVNNGTETASSYVQTKDITLPGNTPQAGTEAYPFTSSYDGGEYKITIESSGGAPSDLSLFGVIGTTDTAPAIYNVISNRRLARTIYNGDIQNCKVQSDVPLSTASSMTYQGASYNSIGGFADIMTGGEILNCYAVTTITAPESCNAAGGFIGNLAGGTVTSCFADADISYAAAAPASSFTAGGFVGNQGINTAIKSSFSSGTMRTKGGGFAGNRRTGSSIEGCLTVMRLLAEDSVPLALSADTQVTTKDFSWSYQACGIKKTDDKGCVTSDSISQNGLFDNITGIDNADPYCIAARIAVCFGDDGGADLFDTSFTIPSGAAIGGSSKAQFAGAKALPQGVEDAETNTICYDFRTECSDQSGDISLTFLTDTDGANIEKKMTITLSEPVKVTNLSDFENGTSASRYILEADVDLGGKQLFDSFSGVITSASGEGHKVITGLGGIHWNTLIQTLTSGGVLRSLTIDRPDAALAHESSGVMEDIIIQSPHISATGGSGEEGDMSNAAGAAANTAGNGALFSNIRVRHGKITTGEYKGGIQKGVAGGIVGILGTEGAPCKVIACISALDSITGFHAGGIAGQFKNGTISRSFSIGDVTGHNFAGGIAGWEVAEEGDTCSIEKVYSCANITTSVVAGGICASDIPVSDSYFAGTLVSKEPKSSNFYAIAEARFSGNNHIQNCYYDQQMTTADVDDSKLSTGYQTAGFLKTVDLQSQGFTKSEDRYPALDTSTPGFCWNAEDELWQKAATLPIWMHGGEHIYADNARDVKYPVKVSTAEGLDYSDTEVDQTADNRFLAPEKEGDFEIKAAVTSGGLTANKTFRLRTTGFTYLDRDAFSKLKELDKETNYCLLVSEGDNEENEKIFFRAHRDYKPGVYKGMFLGDGAVIAGLSAPFIASLEGGSIIGLTVAGSRIQAYNTTGIIAESMSDQAVIFLCSSEGDIRLKNNMASAGGIAGSVEYSKIQNCYSFARIRSSGGYTANNAGGIAGTLSASSRIENAYFSGNIAAGKQVGGIAGYAKASSITDVYAYGQLKASSGGTASGIAAAKEGGIISNAYYDPQITCTSVLDAEGTAVTTKELIEMDMSLNGFEAHNTNKILLPSLYYNDPEHSGLTGGYMSGGMEITSTVPVELAEGETLNSIKSDFTLGDTDQLKSWKVQTLTTEPSASINLISNGLNTVAAVNFQNKLPITNSFGLTHESAYGIRLLYADLINTKAKDGFRAVYEKEDNNSYYFKIKRFLIWEGDTGALVEGTTGRTQTVSYKTFRGTVPEGKIFKDISGNVTFDRDTTELKVSVPKTSQSGAYFNETVQFYLELTEASEGGVIINAGGGENCCKIKPANNTTIESKYIYQKPDSSFRYTGFKNEAFDSGDGPDTLAKKTARTYGVNPFVDSTYASVSKKYEEYFASTNGKIYVQLETMLSKMSAATSTLDVTMDITANETGLFSSNEDIYNVKNSDLIPVDYSDWNNATLNTNAVTGEGDKRAFVFPANMNDKRVLITVDNTAKSYGLSVDKIGSRALFGKTSAPAVLMNTEASKDTYRNGEMVYVAITMGEIIESLDMANSFVTLSDNEGNQEITLDYISGEGTSRLLFGKRCTVTVPESGVFRADVDYHIEKAEGVSGNRAEMLEGWAGLSLKIIGNENSLAPQTLRSRSAQTGLLKAAAKPSPASEQALMSDPGRTELTAADFASEEMFRLIKKNLETNVNVTDFDGEHVYQDQCDKITYLAMDGAGLTSMKGVDKLPNLTFLSLKDNRISSLQELQNLAHLEELHLNQNELTSLAGLGDNPALKKLLVNKNKLTTTEGISGCTALTAFQAVSNQITDITGLPSTLETLMLTQNKITRIHGLEQLSNLKRMSLGENPVKKMEGLDNLTGLNYLGLVGCKIEQLDGIENLTGLNILFLTRNSLKTLRNFNTLPAGITLATVSLNDIDIKGGYKEYKALKAAYGNHLLIGLQGAVDGAVYEQPKVLFYEDALESDAFESTVLLDGKKLSAGFTTAGPGKHVVSRMDGAAGTELTETFRAKFTVKGADHGNTGKNGTARTGDTSMASLYLLLMLAGAAVFVTVLVLRKKHRIN